MRSAQWFERALRVIPGGVNSPVRAFGAVGGEPVYVTEAAGARLRTVEGRELVDFCGSWGPLILGHAHPEVVAAVREAAARGTSFGINTPREVAFAELLCRQIPYAERVRLVSSGTEAAMTALRLARGVTGRHRILKFDGCYHGHVDCLLVSAGSGLLSGGQAASRGIPPAEAGNVLVAPYNDIDAVRAVAAAHGAELAAIVVEPLAGNMGLVLPRPGFLEGLRKAADACGALLVFDEVITGFRFGPTTYGTLCGVAPDLTCLGKIIGGGMPIGAVAGRAEFMDALAPLGGVYQAGTLSGNPVALAAGLATLEILVRQPPYERLAALGGRLREGLADAARRAGLALRAAGEGGVFTPFFTAEPVVDLVSARTCNTALHARFFHAMLERGYYLPPSQFECCFLSAAHGEAQVEGFVKAAGESLETVAEEKAG